MRREIRDNGRGDRTLWSRYEIKYLINESTAAGIAHFIRPYVRLDHYCQIRPAGSYPIVSLYLDSNNLLLCKQSMRGQKNRFKLRIRSYTDDAGYPCFFEIKRRTNTVIIKSRARVLPKSISELLTGVNGLAKAADGEREALEQFLLYMNSLNARPVVRTRYQRQAFESVIDKKVRITFDREMGYSVTYGPDVSLNGTGWQSNYLNGVIMEIKFTGRYPAWLARLVSHFNLRQLSISKYVSSIKQACSLGYGAPGLMV